MLLFRVFDIRFLSTGERLSGQYEFGAIEEIMTCGFYRKHKATSQTLLVQQFIIIIFFNACFEIEGFANKFTGIAVK